MKAGAFLAPSVARVHGFHAVHQILFNPSGGALPLNHVLAVAYVYRPGKAVETEATPVPQLEGEYAGGCTDFKHHGSRTRTVYSSGRNQEVVMLLRRPLVHIARGVKRFARFLRMLESIYHFDGIYILTQSEKHGGTLRFGIQKIIAFVLGIVYSESIADILCGGMHLQAQIAALHGVEKVETYGEILAETRLHRSA